MNYYLFDDKQENSLIQVDYNSIGSDISIKLLELKNQIKIIHWQTENYSEHKTLDNLFMLLGQHIDRWVETFMGKYGRIKLSKKGEIIELKNNKSDKNSIIKYLGESITGLRRFRDEYFNKSDDSDLSNIFDEIFADLNRARYLLSLK